MQSALILDSHLKSALAATRSLGKHKINIVCGSDKPCAMASYSRFTDKKFTYTSPKVDQAAFIADIKKQAKRLPTKPVVYAFSDASWLTLWKFRGELSECCVFVWPQEKAVAMTFNKTKTLQLARQLNIPITPTQFVDSTEHLSGQATFPAVVKNAQSVVWKDEKAVSGTARFVHSHNELVITFNEIKNQTGQVPLVQEFVEGKEYGVEFLAKEGEVLAEFAHERLRSLSPTGGASVLKKTADESDLVATMRRHARALARELAWTGPMMVEFKVDKKTNEPLLMEINGRFWGSLHLPVVAGVDFPWLYYQLVSQQSTDKVSRGTPTTTNHFLGDAVHLMRVWFANDRMREYVYPDRLSALKDFLLVPLGTKQDVWSWTDPLPSVMEYIGAAHKFRS